MVVTNVWPVRCYLYTAERMGCLSSQQSHQTNQSRICQLCVYHVIKRRVSGFDELCVRVRVCSFPCLLLCTSFSSLTHLQSDHRNEKTSHFTTLCTLTCHALICVGTHVPQRGQLVSICGLPSQIPFVIIIVAHTSFLWDCS